MTVAPKPAGQGRRAQGHRAAHTQAQGGSGKKVHRTKAQQRATRKMIRASARARRRGLSLDGIEVMEEVVEFGRTDPYHPWEKPRLVLEHHLDTSILQRPPAIVDRASKVATWPMYGNDRLPDCTFATIGHQIQAWTAYAGTEADLPENVIEQAFAATGPMDQGRNVQDVLNYWRKTGVGGHKIAGFAQLSSLDNLVLAKQCLHMFGTIYLGIQVPESAMEQFRNGQPWDYVGDHNIVGGHAIPVQYWGTNEIGEIEPVSWAKRQRMTRAFWYNYVEEAWVVWSQDWLTAGGLTPLGLNVEQMRAEFESLTGEYPAF